ncbi:hypothetical protein MPER_06788 [Moniliophthora perniciosa FA553]|nr:hypothetical protein MPER_06788 [Moniliophthora perniciosa FA553]
MKGNASIQNKTHKRVYNEWAKAAKKESQTQDAVEKMELEIQGLSMAQNRTHEQDAHLARLRAMLTAKKGELREQGLDTIALKQLLDRFERGKNGTIDSTSR